mgnify:CR=1 FL=1
MKNKAFKMNLPTLDSLFTTQEERDNPKILQVTELPINIIKDFPNHPFKVVDDEYMDDMVESVKVSGVIMPVIVRKEVDGSYCMISGHRRKHAATRAGLEKIPSIVMKLTDDEATLLMVDTNINQRLSLLASERAFAYKMKLDAMRHQAGRPSEKNYSQVGNNFGKTSSEEMAEELGTSKNQIFRYIRLTELIPEILDMVDNGQIKFNPAVELSYLAREEQQDFLSAMDYAQAAPSLSQAQRIKKLAQEGECTLDAMCEIMNEVKKGELDRVTFKTDSLRKYFPKSYTSKQMEDKIIQLLEQWQKKREKSMER